MLRRHMAVLAIVARTRAAVTTRCDMQRYSGQLPLALRRRVGARRPGRNAPTPAPAFNRRDLRERVEFEVIASGYLPGTGCVSAGRAVPVRIQIRPLPPLHH